MFYLYNNYNNTDEAKVLCLYFNSIVMIIQFLLRKSETLGTHYRLKIDDWVDILIPNLESIDKADFNNLLKTFEEIKNSNFPCFYDQFSLNFNARKKLDEAVLCIFKLNKKEINDLIKEIYPIIANELHAMRDMKQ